MPDDPYKPHTNLKFGNDFRILLPNITLGATMGTTVVMDGQTLPGVRNIEVLLPANDVAIVRVDFLVSSIVMEKQPA